MARLKRYVLSGDFERDAEQGFTILHYVTVAVLVLAAVVFAPVVISIFFGR